MSKIYHYLTLSLFFLLSNSFSVASTINFNFIKEDTITSATPHNMDVLKTDLVKVMHIKDSEAEATIRRKIGKAFFEMGNIREALDYFITSKIICEQHHFNYEKALVYEELANVYMFIAEHQKQYDLILKAIKIYEQFNDSIALARSYTNLASGEKFRNAKNTLVYLNQAKSYNQNFQNKQIDAYTNINFGEYYLRLNQPDSAYYYLKLALPITQQYHLTARECETFVKLARAMETLNKDSSIFLFNEAYRKSILYKNYLWAGRSLIFLAKIDFENDRKIDAFQKIHQSIDYTKASNDIIMNRSAYDLISYFHLQEGNIDSAFYYDQLADNLKDTIKVKQNIAAIKNIEWGYKLKDKENQIRHLQENKETLELKQKSENKAKIWTWIALFILLGLVIVLFLFFKNRISLLMKEKQIIKLKQEKYKAEIETKNKELVTHTMQIYSKSKTISDLKNGIENLKNEHIKNSNPKFIKDIQQLNFMLDSNIRLDDEWEKLKIRFQEVHQGFYDKLKKQYPDLSQYDLKICTFIYLGFDTKQIAQILNIDFQSLRTQRYRMRKKMQLATKDDLSEYIIKIVSV